MRTCHGSRSDGWRSGVSNAGIRLQGKGAMWRNAQRIEELYLRTRREWDEAGVKDNKTHT
jgi:hypothetical protein